MARIPYPDPAVQSEEIRDRLQRTGSLNITRMMSHAEGLMLAYSRMGTQILLRGTLDPVLRELVILRIGQLCDSDYEWHQHVSVAKAVGMDDAMLEAVADKAFDRLPEKERVVIAVAEEIRRAGAVGDETFARARTMFSPNELVELVITAGYYVMTAGFLRSFAIEIEDTPPLGDTMAATRSG